MTEQKAIDLLDNLVGMIDDNHCSDYDSAFKMAIEALEKQIPKKPLFGTALRDTTYHCGSCKNFISYYDTRIYEYCHNCGQKLDWSEEE